MTGRRPSPMVNALPQPRRRASRVEIRRHCRKNGLFSAAPPRAIVRAALPLLALCLLLVAAAHARAETDDVQWLAWHTLGETPIDLRAAFVGSHEHVVLVAGGERADGTRSDAVHALLDGESQWREVGRLPRPLAHGAAVNTARGVLLLGGESDRGASDGILLLRWDALSQRAVIDVADGTLPRPMARFAAAVMGTRLYVTGNADGVDKPFFAVTDAQHPRLWETLPPWPGPARRAPALIAQGGAESNYLFLFAGAADGEPLTDAYRYHPATRTWAAIAPPPRPLAHVRAAPLGVAHVLLFAEDAPALAYHTITNTWVAAPIAPPRVNRPLAVLPRDDGLLLVGAAPGDGAPLVAERGAFDSVAARLTWLDYGAVFAYIALMVAVGIHFTRKRGNTTNDFLLAGQSIPWWVAGLSLMATQVSSIGFMAVPAKTFATNWAYFLGVLTWFMAVPIVIHVFIPFYRRLQVVSAYEYLELRFNAAARLLASISFSLMQTGRLAVVLLLPALAISAVTNIDVSTSIIVMGALATVYTVAGGMEAVVWADVIQTTVLLSTVILGIVLAFVGLEGGFGQFLDVVRADDKMQVVVPTMSINAAAFWVIIVGGFFSRLSSLTSDQGNVQRYMITPSVRQARHALWTDVAASIPWAFCVFLFGTMLYVFYKTHPQMLHPAVDTNGVVPLFIAQGFPNGLTGVVIAAVFAAAVADCDSAMHATSTVVTTDFYKRLRPHSSDRAGLIVARLVIVVIGAFGTSLGVYMATADIKSIWDQFITIAGLFVGVIAGLFLLGIFTRRAHGAGAVVGAVVAAGVLYWTQTQTSVHFFLFAAVGIVTCVVVGYLASLVLPGTPRTEGLTIYTVRDQEVDRTADTTSPTPGVVAGQ